MEQRLVRRKVGLSEPLPSNFAWRSGNRFELLIDGQAFFPKIIAAIDAAKTRVLIEMYLVESGRVCDEIVDTLIRAARRGVAVHMLLDAFGCRGFTARDRSRLTQAGIRLTLFNPLRLRNLSQNLYRTHRKIVIADKQVAFTGGAGITDSFAGDGAWHDVMVEIRGPIVADWFALFSANWARWSHIRTADDCMPPEEMGDMLGRVATTHRETQTEIKRAVLTRVNTSSERIWLASAYFVPSRKIRRALRRAARRGIDVRLVLPGRVTDHPAVRQASRRFYARLLRHNVRIFEFKNRFMHTKMVLADDWCSIGSSNLDRWGFRWNLEANQEIEDSGFIDQVSNMLADDMDHSNEILASQWRHRSRMSRLQESVWGAVDLWLARLPYHEARFRSNDRNQRADKG